MAGRGTIAKAKGRRGGFGAFGVVSQEKRRVAKKKREQEAANKIKVNEKIMRQIGDCWATEKARKKYNEQFVEHRVKTAPLAAALHAAMDAKDKV